MAGGRGAGCRPELAGHPRQPGRAVQQRPAADQHDGAGLRRSTASTCLNGDTLKLTFNETGKSTLNITGVTFNDAGLGLSTLTAGTDFLDNNSANNGVDRADATPQTTLRAEASALGSNLSIVQIRQDFIEEPDQRAADRRVQPDAGRLQRGSGQQPGAVDPPVDRGLGAGARQPVAAERAAAAALIPTANKRESKRRGKPRRFS